MEHQKLLQGHTAEHSADKNKKPMDTTALVLSIVTVGAAALLPLVSYVCGIVGVMLVIEHHRERRTATALLLCLIGLAAAAALHTYAEAHLAAVMETLAG